VYRAEEKQARAEGRSMDHLLGRQFVESMLNDLSMMLETRIRRHNEENGLEDPDR